MSYEQNTVILNRRTFVAGLAGAAFLAACGDGGRELPVPAADTGSISRIDGAAEVGAPAVRDQQIPPDPLPDSLFVPGELISNFLTDQKVLCFTFDDGPWPINTEAVMSTFERRGYGGLAKFFMVASCIKQFPNIGRAVIDRGYSVGNHSLDHATYVPGEIAAGIAQAQDIFEEYLGVRPDAFRSPGLTKGDAIQQKLASLGMYNIFTDVNLNDSTMPRIKSPEIISNFARTLHPGTIVLLHDGGSHTETVNAIDGILDVVEREGYKIVTVEDMLRIRAGAIIGSTLTEAYRQNYTQLDPREADGQFDFQVEQALVAG